MIEQKIKQNNFSKKIIVGITGQKEEHWKNKLKEIEKFRISKAALFLECFSKKQRLKIYTALLNSKIKEIPLVHIRNDMIKKELFFLEKNFNSKYFTIHEDSFKVLKKWNGFHKKLFLEFNYDNFVSSSVNIKKIGGFCVDFSHFKAEEEKWSKEFEYIIKRRAIHKYFACNHLNGYSEEKNKDMHNITSLKNFSYLETLPKFLFGKVIAIETNNSISEQLKYKRYVVKVLGRLFDK